ncbi:6-phosphogluconate dehydrogenase C-terminal domain-like protein [Setomelanomma holmii]|uniref:3-hydroxyisobutyrate dehydrogenase n=1 Tax=Setomelanomma holmii TaxID=210430 RepID=A0A9P4LLM4_9PLEO|nr:6-phosphogluconate dehydrogenase C-terminal domain-like protein [Setomelanomma holmii]
MCLNIRRKIPSGSILYINDVFTPSCERFKAENSSLGPIEIVPTAREAAENAEVLISIVPTGKDVKAVYLDEKTGVVAAKKNERRFMLECSTIEVASTQEVGKKLAEEGSGTYIDAPVSGGVPAAEQGTLAMLIGHPQPSYASPASRRLSEVLSMLGSPSKFFYLNDLGAGLTAKIANNYLSGTILLATAEALAMGVKQGLDPSALYSVIKNSTGQSWMCDHVMPIPNVQTEYWVPSNSGYKPGFKTQMMLKDLGLGIDVAKQVGIEPSMAIAAMKVWESAAKDDRCMDRDGSSVYLHVGGILPQGYEDSGKRKADGGWDF